MAVQVADFGRVAIHRLLPSIRSPSEADRWTPLARRIRSPIEADQPWIRH